MEIIKNIAAIVGAILSCITLATVCTKGGRNFVKNLFKKNTEDIRAVNLQQTQEVEEIKRIVSQIRDDLEVVKDGSRQQLRNVIKNVYYRYRKEKIIPLFERKTVDSIYDIYVNGYHSNSYITLLYKEICKWEIDNTTERDIEDEE